MSILLLKKTDRAAAIDSFVPIYRPYQTVDGYNSFVFAERYRNPGDFSIVFKQNVDEVFDLFPERALIAHSDSDEVMIVENRVVEEDDDGNSTLTVTGRSFEVLNEGRVARPQSPRSDPKVYGIDPQALHYSDTPDVTNDWAVRDTSSNIARMLLDYWTVRVAANGNKDQYGLGLTSYQVTSIAIPGAIRSMIIAPGSIYERVLEILKMDDLGVRNLRPTLENNLSKLTTQIYSGTDHTEDVVLSYDAGHFKKASYGWSAKDAKSKAWNFAYDLTNITTRQFETSIDLRIGYNEMSDIKTENTLNRPEFFANLDAMSARGRTYLEENKYQELFACELSTSLPYEYNVDFGLGDLVRVQGRFGTDQTMRVSEYIRIDDENGKSAYPTLSIKGADIT